MMSEFNEVISKAIEMISTYKAEMTQDPEYIWSIDIDSCRWAVEQAIINRNPSKSMLAAAIEYVESVERRADSFNGIYA